MTDYSKIVLKYDFPKFKRRPQFTQYFVVDVSKEVLVGGMNEKGFNLKFKENNNPSNLVITERELQNLMDGNNIQSSGANVTIYSKFADGGMLNLLADTSGAGLQNVGGTSFSDVDLTSHMDLTNPMFANGGELHRSQEGMYAKGGQTSKYKYKVILVIKNSNSDSYENVLPIDVALFMSKGDALMCVRSLQEKAPSNYQYRLQDN